MSGNDDGNIRIYKKPYTTIHDQTDKTLVSK